MKNSTEKQRESLQNFHPKTPSQTPSKNTPKRPEKICLIELPLKYNKKLKVNDSSKISITCNTKEYFVSGHNHLVIFFFEEFKDCKD